MKLKDTEYRVGILPTKAGFSDAIVITKEALEEWRDHYFEVATNMERFPIDQWQQKFYLGKAEVLTELLKHFDNEDNETV